MNYEQKYKEALEKARQFSERPLEEDSSSIVEYIFPELKESEDERIRKAVIEMIHDTPNIECEENYNVRKEDVLAWLEKQGEKKPIEWKDSDEKYLFWALSSIQKDIAASEINGVNTKDLNDCVKWLYSLKQRIGG